MSEGEDDVSGHAWPGFVDVLSSTLIMFVFFLLIVAVALNLHVMMFKAKLEATTKELIEQRVKSEKSSEAKQLEEENKLLKLRVEELEMQITGTAKAFNTQIADMVATKDQSTSANAAAKSLVVFFPPDGVTVTDKTLEEIQKFLAAYPNKKTVVLSSSRKTTNKQEIVARKIAVSRILNVRNVVLDAKVPSGNIAAEMTDADAIDGKPDWVKIEIRE